MNLKKKKRILEWVAISYTRGSTQPRDRTLILCLLHWQVDTLPLAPSGEVVPPQFIKEETPKDKEVECCGAGGRWTAGAALASWRSGFKRWFM